MFHRIDRHLHQVAPVVERPDFNVMRQEVAVDLLGLCFHSFEDVLRLLTGEHEDDAFDPVVIVLEAELSEAGSVADGDLADVADAHRHAIVIPHDNVADVFGLRD